ncbi:MAG: hypothetical protein ACR5K2_02805 [Wolbachia sp.]
MRKIFKNTYGIKRETLKSVLQFALSNGVEINIVSYTGYSNAVKEIAEDYFGLSRKKIDSVSVFGGISSRL